MESGGESDRSRTGSKQFDPQTSVGAGETSQVPFHYSTIATYTCTCSRSRSSHKLRFVCELYISFMHLEQALNK